MTGLLDTLVKIQEIIRGFDVHFSLKNSKGQYFFANDAWLSTLSLEKDQVIGKTDHELLPRHVAEFVAKSDSEAVVSNTVQKYWSNYSYRGEEVQYIALKWKIVDPSGNLFCICTVEDREFRVIVELEDRVKKAFINLQVEA